MVVVETEVAVPVTGEFPRQADLGTAPVWKIIPVMVTETVESVLCCSGELPMAVLHLRT